MFDNPERSNGIELHVATEDIAWEDLAAAFTEVSGRNAVYRDIDLNEYFARGSSHIRRENRGHSESQRANFGHGQREFSGFWNIWKDELTKRDYKLLDEILPSRVKLVKEWMVKTGYTGEVRSALRGYRDGSKSA